MDLTTLRASDFEPYVDQVFDVVGADDCELTLASVETLRQHDSARREPFALVFKGDRARVLEQRTYELRHPETGLLEIFLVPVGQDLEATLYEAVFN